MATEKPKAQATEAAQSKAEELEVNVANVKGTGKDGSVTKEDVVAAANEPEKNVVLRVESDPLADEFTGPDGKSYKTGDVVTESKYDELRLSDGTGDRRVFYKKGEV